MRSLILDQGVHGIQGSLSFSSERFAMPVFLVLNSREPTTWEKEGRKRREEKERRRGGKEGRREGKEGRKEGMIKKVMMSAKYPASKPNALSL